MTRALPIIALCLLLAPAARAAEATPTLPPAPADAPPPAPDTWPHYRGGPAQLGRAAGVLPADLALRWTATTKDEIRSSAVIAHGRVYVGSMDRHVYAFDLQTGATAWTFAAADAVEASPTLIADTLVVGSADGVLHALDPHTGAERWSYETDASR